MIASQSSPQKQQPQPQQLPENPNKQTVAPSQISTLEMASNPAELVDFVRCFHTNYILILIISPIMLG